MGMEREGEVKSTPLTIFFGWHFFLGAISLRSVVVPYPKIVINLPGPMRSYIVKKNHIRGHWDSSVHTYRHPALDIIVLPKHSNSRVRVQIPGILKFCKVFDCLDILNDDKEW